MGLHAQWEVLFSPEAMNDLRWWSTQLHPHCSSPMLKLEASVVITSDVSLHGWGAVCQEVTTGGLWTTGEAGSHINLLELKAAYLALHYSLKESVRTCFGIRLDNQTTISYLNHIGTLTFPLCQLALNIWTWCLTHQITLHAECLSGTEYYSRLGIKALSWQQQLGTLPVSAQGTESSTRLILYRSVCFQNHAIINLPVYCCWKPNPGT